MKTEMTKKIPPENYLSSVILIISLLIFSLSLRLELLDVKQSESLKPFGKHHLFRNINKSKMLINQNKHHRHELKSQQLILFSLFCSRKILNRIKKEEFTSYLS